MCVWLCVFGCVCVWVGSMSVHWCMQSRINNCCNPVRLVYMIHCLWMIQRASKSTTSVPQIQRFDSLEAGKRIPIWPLVMTLTAFASIIYLSMTQYYFSLKIALHQSEFFFVKLGTPNCQVLLYTCSVRDLDVLVRQFGCLLKCRLKVPWEYCLIGFTSWGHFIRSCQWSARTLRPSLPSSAFLPAQPKPAPPQPQ